MKFELWSTGFSVLCGGLIWWIAESGEPGIAAATVAMVLVKYLCVVDRRNDELEKRLNDLSWRLREVLKDK